MYSIENIYPSLVGRNHVGKLEVRGMYRVGQQEMHSFWSIE